MKYLYFILFVICFTSCNEKNFVPRFLIVENGKTGFIDSNGKVVIRPQFHDASEFSEGLAAARINGRYGYIDEKGQFTIKPEFEFATPFSEGLAIVYKDGKSFFINLSGKKVFDCPFMEVSPFRNGRSIVKTASRKYGILNPQGKLFIDTVYSKIEPFQDGMAIMHNLNKKDPRSCVIDSLGKVIIPFQKYDRISDYANGYFTVWSEIKEGVHKCSFVDPNGKVAFSRMNSENSY